MEQEPGQQHQMPPGALVQRQNVAVHALPMSDPDGPCVLLRIEHASGSTILPLDPGSAKEIGTVIAAAAEACERGANAASKLIIPQAQVPSDLKGGR